VTTIPRTLNDEITRMQAAEGMRPGPVPLAMLATVNIRYLESFDNGIAVWTSDPRKAMLADPGLAEVVTNILRHDGLELRRLQITP
jgi:hypothetical protein